MRGLFQKIPSKISHLSSGVMDAAASGVNGTEAIEGLRVEDVLLSNATISVNNSTNSSIEACQVSYSLSLSTYITSLSLCTLHIVFSHSHHISKGNLYCSQAAYDEEFQKHELVMWWVEYILQTIVGVAGLLANTIAIPVLNTKEVRVSDD